MIQLSKARIIAALEAVALSKNISKQQILNFLKEQIAHQLNLIHPEFNISVGINNQGLYASQHYTLVDQVTDPNNQLTIAQYQQRNLSSNNLQVGDQVTIDITHLISRRLISLVSKATTDFINYTYITNAIEKTNRLVYGKICFKEANHYVVDINLNVNAILPLKNCAPNERFCRQEHFFAYVVKNSNDTIILSRTCFEFVEKILEKYIPEIKNGDVTVANIARFPGVQTKIAVYSNNPNIDAVAVCVGYQGSKVKQIAAQLNYELIDFVTYHTNLVEYAKSCLAQTTYVYHNVDQQVLYVYVPAEEYGKYLGVKAQNVILCSILLKYAVKIKIDLYQKFLTLLTVDQQVKVEKNKELFYCFPAQINELAVALELAASQQGKIAQFLLNNTTLKQLNTFNSEQLKKLADHQIFTLSELFLLSAEQLGTILAINVDEAGTYIAQLKDLSNHD